MFFLYLLLGITYPCTAGLCIILLKQFYEADADYVFYSKMSLLAYVPVLNLIALITYLEAYYRYHSMPLKENPSYIARVNNNLTSLSPKYTMQEFYLNTLALNEALYRQCQTLIEGQLKFKPYIDQDSKLLRTSIALTLIFSNLTELKSSRTSLTQSIALQMRLINLRNSLDKFNTVIVNTICK